MHRSFVLLLYSPVIYKPVRNNTEVLFLSGSGSKWRFSTAWYGTVQHGSVRYGTAQFRSFVFPLQFSTAIEWAGLFTRRYNCAASTAVTSSRMRHKKTLNKERRRNSVLHSRHVDVFNSNGEVYENAWDLPAAAETVAVTRAVEEDGRCAALLD